MNYLIGDYMLRLPEPADLELLYIYKNDAEIAALLGGFTTGYTMADLGSWLAYHRGCKDEVLWVIAEAVRNRCVGHVGLYQIDHRIRMAEFAILIGDRALWGRGIGRACTAFALEYGFRELNLNRIYLSLLASNERAAHLYRSFGFTEEGRLRQAQYKGGQYIDVIMMGLLKAEYLRDDG